MSGRRPRNTASRCPRVQPGGDSSDPLTEGLGRFGRYGLADRELAMGLLESMGIMDAERGPIGRPARPLGAARRPNLNSPGDGG